MAFQFISKSCHDVKLSIHSCNICQRKVFYDPNEERENSRVTQTLSVLKKFLTDQNIFDVIT